MKIIGMIPSRLASSRLPNKALVDISGIPMLAHVIKRAQMSTILNELYVVTDSLEIAKIAKANNCKYLISEESHNTGTDRIGEAASKLSDDIDIVVNIQGDEALVCPEHIDLSAKILIDNSNFEMSMLATKYKKPASLSDIKIAMNLFNEIMYFSRADIPYQSKPLNPIFYKAYHVVSFKIEALRKFCLLEQTPIEKLESIEYMRAVENRMKIGCHVIESNAISVDTPQDLEEVRSMMRDDKIAKKYL